MTALLLWALVDARATIASGALFLPAVAAPLFFYAHPVWAKAGTPASYWIWAWISAGAIAVMVAWLHPPLSVSAPALPGRPRAKLGTLGGVLRACFALLP